MAAKLIYEAGGERRGGAERGDGRGSGGRTGIVDCRSEGVRRVGKGDDKGRRVGGLKAREEGGKGLDEGESVRDGKGWWGVRDKWMGQGSEKEHWSAGRRVMKRP
jgi:hypothetical protein